MSVREATIEDADDIREIAERSFRSSYSLSPQEIEIIVEAEFSREAFEDRIDDDSGVLLVATESEEEAPDSDISGFAELDADGVFRWMHVHPNARGRGVGSTLLERIQEETESRDGSFSAIILEDASEGDQVLERIGLSRTGGSEIEIGGERFHVQQYEMTDEEHAANEPSVDVPETVEQDGETVRVDAESDISGTLAPFYPMYGDDEEPVGFFCSQCGTTEVSAGSLDRLECSECGNLHRADDWDASYL